MTNLERAYLDGARDDKTVKALGRIYVKEGRWVDAALLYEGAAEDPSRGWKSKIWYLKRACARYNRVKDMKAFVRCHRKARSLVPDEVDATLKLDLWWPPGLATAYPHVGAADEVLSELRAVEEAIGEEWTIYGRFVFHFARSLVYRELENWDKMIDECTQFLVWAENLSEADSQFQRMHINIDEDGTPELVGESGRCYCACSVLFEGIIPAERKFGRDSGNTLDDSDRWLTRYEKLYQSTQCESDGNPNDQGLHALAETYKNRVATCYGKAAVAAFETGQTARALAYFQQSESLGDKIDGIWQFYKAAALLSDGQTSEAKTCLQEISGSVVSDGRSSAIFDKLKEFDSIRNDPDIVELAKHWKNRNVRL